jgi:hypothetical protein
MIAPASPADWLQGLTMTALLAGAGITFSWMLGLEEPTIEEPRSRSATCTRLAAHSSSAPSTRRSCVEGTK